MNEHTEGPWAITRNVDEELVVAAPKSGIIIAVVGNKNESETPNVRLIAAAPDLLEACRKLAAWDRSADDVGLISEACSMAREAIAKAEGR